MLDAELLGATSVDQLGVVAVIHLVTVKDVAQRIPLSGSLAWHVDGIVCIPQER
jgi:hypothetical protein